MNTAATSDASIAAATDTPLRYTDEDLVRDFREQARAFFGDGMVSEFMTMNRSHHSEFESGYFACLHDLWNNLGLAEAAERMERRPNAGTA